MDHPPVQVTAQAFDFDHLTQRQDLERAGWEPETRREDFTMAHSHPDRRVLWTTKSGWTSSANRWTSRADVVPNTLKSLALRKDFVVARVSLLSSARRILWKA